MAWLGLGWLGIGDDRWGPRVPPVVLRRAEAGLRGGNRFGGWSELGRPERRKHAGRGREKEGLS